jgi:hypothetical protein
MMLDCPHLALGSRSATDEDGKGGVVVLAVDALRLRSAGRCELAESSETVFGLETLCREEMWALRSFVQKARLGSPYSTRVDDDDLSDVVAQGLRRGILVCVYLRDATADSDLSQIQRRLARSVERMASGPLRDGSKQYKLVAGEDLRGMPERESYEVVSRAEAERVLTAVSNHAGRDLAEILGKAKDALSPDWRPPLQPRGVVLLRRVYAPSVMVASQEPALTPSQLWGKAKVDDEIIDWKIWIELDPSDSKASDDVVILLDEFHQEVMRKPLASCPREGTGVLVTFEQINKNAPFTLIRDYGPNEGGGQDTLFINSSPAEMDERGRQAEMDT